jgi:hypothetical protein
MPMISVYNAHQNVGYDMTKEIYNDVSAQQQQDPAAFQTYINDLVVADMNQPSWTPRRTLNRIKNGGKLKADLLRVGFNGTQGVSDWMQRMSIKHIESLIMEDKGHVYDDNDNLQYAKPEPLPA